MQVGIHVYSDGDEGELKTKEVEEKERGCKKEGAIWTIVAQWMTHDQ